MTLSSQQPAASSQQPAASSQQPAASSQQPAASSQQPAASIFSFRAIRYLVGALLLSAAGLKLFGMTFSPVTLGTWEAYPGLGYGLVLFETMLGCWLLVGIAPFASWLTTLLVFVTFAFVSGYSVWQGQASCDCFGAMPTPPVYVFGLDVVVILCLALFRPLGSRSDFISYTQHLSKYATGIGSIGVVVWVACWVGFGSIQQAIAYFRDEPIRVDPTILNMGAVHPNELKEFTVTISNNSQNPIRLLGGTTDCSCVTTKNLPLTLMPGQQGTLPIFFRISSYSQGAVTRKVWLYTDHPGLRFVTIYISGMIE